MKLKTLKPRIQQMGSRVQALKPTRVGSVERKRGSAGVKDRNAIKERDAGLCQMCLQAGRVTLGSEVDHRIPLFAGGSDEADNKWLLCKPCHDEKTRKDLGHSKRVTYGEDGWPIDG